ncbi:hypothetical protein BN341_16290 [Helicobacter heilmannii ASB1.4]|uniref:Uncharacterized protein n=1 Tax=Helicobacter heilmannii TaxID=35817 RepID=A0A0K2Y7R8_HELHE|nr:hypothetical protein BN341_16290 [Helicobacter heilmannii ASB1.4]CRI35201.1 hypothetical protein HHE01_01990 [Helicobacter heilmannii]
MKRLSFNANKDGWHNHSTISLKQTSMDKTSPKQGLKMAL